MNPRTKISNKDLKRRIIEISYPRKLSHLGSALTAVDIIKEIYDKKKPREKFILSAGHAHIAHAVVMEQLGLIKDAGDNIDKFGIHCEREGGCDVSTGSLGMGLSIACGMALADRSKNVYCLISDGECAEGSIWEALTIAEDQTLNNLRVFINFNGYGAYRETKARDINTLPFHYLVAKTNFNDFPFLKGQDAHYHVMTEEEHREAMDILS